MNGRNIVMVIIIVGALVVAGVLVAKQLTGKGDHVETLQQVMYYTCADCKKDFTLTVAELMEIKADSQEAPVHCPNCNSIATSKGHPCWSCGRVLVTGAHGQMPDKCPYCGSGMTDSPNTGTP